MNIIVTDAETLPTMINEIQMVVDKLIVLIEKVEYTIFYEFLTNFVSAIDKFLVNQYILRIFDALVENIVREQTKKLNGLEHQDIVIQKSIGVIRKICRNNTYMSVHSQAFETSLAKIFVFMEDP